MRIAELAPVKASDLKERTKRFALRTIRMADFLPRQMPADVIGRQLVRSATSVAANYRSACRAKSRADFISKMGTVEEEADESGLWLELIVDAGVLPAAKLLELRREPDELTAIAVQSIRTARRQAIPAAASPGTPQSKIRNPQSP